MYLCWKKYELKTKRGGYLTMYYWGHRVIENIKYLNIFFQLIIRIGSPAIPSTSTPFNYNFYFIFPRTFNYQFAKSVHKSESLSSSIYRIGSTIYFRSSVVQHPQGSTLRSRSFRRRRALRKLKLANFPTRQAPSKFPFGFRAIIKPFWRPSRGAVSHRVEA